MPPNMQNEPSPLGGFFGLERPGAGGLVRHWGVDPALAWANASSAFAAVVRHLRPKAVWLPGYLCLHMAEAVPMESRRFYRLNSAMEPDLDSLAGLQAGDLVLCVAYFGRTPGPAWRDFLANRPDVWAIEDCAQALDSGSPACGDWRIYSPRKLMGVPEGGLLAAMTARAQTVPGPTLPPDQNSADRRLLPMQLRRERPLDNALWHPLHQAAEAAGGLSDRAISAQAMDLLGTLDPAPMIAARKDNFARLHAKLGQHAFIDDPAPAFTPLGFPVLLPSETRDGILHRLFAQKIFPAVHWRDIAAPQSFAEDHKTAAQIATLPCDHRYGPQDMDRLANVFLGALK